MAMATSIVVAVRPQCVNPTMATTLRWQQLHGQMQRSKCKQFDAGTTTTTTMRDNNNNMSGHKRGNALIYGRKINNERTVHKVE